MHLPTLQLPGQVLDTSMHRLLEHTPVIHDAFNAQTDPIGNITDELLHGTLESPTIPIKPGKQLPHVLGIVVHQLRLILGHDFVTTHDTVLIVLRATLTA